MSEAAPPGSTTIVLVVSSPVPLGDIAELCGRVRTLLRADNSMFVACAVSAVGDTDAVVLDALARLQLTARRQGGSIQLFEAPGKLHDLLDVAGLSEVVPFAGALHLELAREIEEREQVRIDEEVDPADPAV